MQLASTTTSRGRYTAVKSICTHHDQHDAVEAVEHCVAHIRHLGACGARVVDHALQDLAGHDDGLARQVGLGGQPLLGQAYLQVDEWGPVSGVLSLASTLPVAEASQAARGEYRWLEPRLAHALQGHSTLVKCPSKGRLFSRDLPTFSASMCSPRLPLLTTTPSASSRMLSNASMPAAVSIWANTCNTGSTLDQAAVTAPLMSTLPDRALQGLAAPHPWLAKLRS